jgi:hypothetical protein
LLASISLLEIEIKGYHWVIISLTVPCFQI